MSRRTVLLEHERIACDVFDRRKHLLRQHDIAIVLSVDLHSWLNEYQFSHAHLRHSNSTDTMIDFVNVERVRISKFPCCVISKVVVLH